MRQATSDRIAAARFWIVPALCLAAAVTAALPLIKPALGNLPVPFIWTPAMLAAAICWMIKDDLRWTARFILYIAVVALGMIIFYIRPSYPSLADIASMLAARNAATWNDGVVFTLILIAVIASFGPAEPTRLPLLPRRALSINGLVLALLIAAAVPAGLGIRTLTRDQERSHAETMTRYHPPKTTDTHTNVPIGEKHGWSRTDLNEVIPAGDQMIGIKAGTVLGLRSSDGATLWRYHLKYSVDHRYGYQHKIRGMIDAVLADTHSRTVLIQVENNLVGVKFDGTIAYHTQLPRAAEGNALQQLNHSSRAAVAIFSARSNPVYGYSVATGKRLWRLHYHRTGCSVDATSHNKSAYLITAGKPPCRTRVIRHDGARQRYDTTLKSPSGTKTSDFLSSPSGSDPPIVSIGSATVAASLEWSNTVKGSRPKKERRRALIDPSGNVQHTLDERSGSKKPHDARLFPLNQTSSGKPRFGMLRPDPGTNPRWILFDHRLQKKHAQDISPASVPEVHRIGGYLDLSDNDGKIHNLRRIDEKLTSIETIDVSKLGKPTGCKTPRRDGDDHHLVLNCTTVAKNSSAKKRIKHTFYVRAVT